MFPSWRSLFPHRFSQRKNFCLLNQTLSLKVTKFTFLPLLCAEGRRIPTHVSALCAQPSVHIRIASLCSESSPQIVQTSPSRLAGASAVTSPIHPSLDACQPGAARAVSMETSNKRARTPPFTCVNAARGALRTNRLWGFCRSFITLKQRDQITALRTCRAAAVSRRQRRRRRRRRARHDFVTAF